MSGFNYKAVRGIPTTYCGVTFRSRLEARFACFFDSMEWDWDYEPAFLKGKPGWIPDFRLNLIQPIWVEVKPEASPFVGERLQSFFKGDDAPRGMLLFDPTDEDNIIFPRISNLMVGKGCGGNCKWSIHPGHDLEEDAACWVCGRVSRVDFRVIDDAKINKRLEHHWRDSAIGDSHATAERSAHPFWCTFEQRFSPVVLPVWRELSAEDKQYWQEEQEIYLRLHPRAADAHLTELRAEEDRLQAVETEQYLAVIEPLARAFRMLYVRGEVLLDDATKTPEERETLKRAVEALEAAEAKSQAEAAAAVERAREEAADVVAAAEREAAAELDFEPIAPSSSLVCAELEKEQA